MFALVQRAQRLAAGENAREQPIWDPILGDGMRWSSLLTISGRYDQMPASS